MTETKSTAATPASGPGAAMVGHSQQQFITTGTPLVADPAPTPSRPLDQTVPGGVYIDGKTGKPHDAHGNAIDAESLKAAGIDLGKPKKGETPHVPPTLSELSLTLGGPSAVPEAPSESEEEPDEKAKEKEAEERALESDAGAPGRPTKAAAEAGQKAASEAEKQKKEQEKEKEKEKPSAGSTAKR
ncbi:MAG TPA: hypothetical protein VH439_17405 [Gemmatimonadales bacterium]|jgi:hypothetical protein